MDPSQFKKEGLHLLEYIVNYHERVSGMTVNPVSERGDEIVPGFLREKLTEKAPQLPAEWNKILEEFEREIVAGVKAMISLCQMYRC